MISYGSCQFPTMGFVVQRYKEVQDFIPEMFWKIKGLLSKIKPGIQILIVHNTETEYLIYFSLAYYK